MSVAEALGLFGEGGIGGFRDALADIVLVDAFFLHPFLDRQVEVEDVGSAGLQADGIPLFGIGALGNMLVDEILDDLVAHVGDGLGDVRRFHQFEALLEDHLALIVENVVVLQEVLADVEVAGFDLLLGALQRLVDPGMDDRLAFLEAELRAACRPCGRSRRCASGRPEATGRTSSGRGRPDGRNGRAAGCRCGGFRGVRWR